ncbi:MAG TPA: hypothetical protein DGG94_18965, partial [Micromonosporaceae bacterium]|nr:hypothetical protein [Micromonosporaceae bacterium]
IDSNHTGFSGTGFCNATNAVGGHAEWTVNASAAGQATIGIRYANGTTTNRPADIVVNGTVVQAAAAFNGTGAWTTWATKSLTASLNAGSNTIRISATSANGPANLDYLEVDAAPPATEYQAESAVITQGVVESNHAGFTGTGFVNYNNVSGSAVEFTVNVSATASTTLRFRYANGTTTNRPMSITVNGSVVSSNLAFNGTGAWSTWSEATVTANLNAGSNTIRATATTAGGGPNLDKLTLGGGGGGPTAAELLAKVTSCTQISNGRYRSDSETAPTIPVCQKTGAVFWQGDMDIDCDGIRTPQCNEDTDCCFLPDTACHSSTDQPLNAAQLPYVVVPSPSGIWDYRNHQIGCGTAIAIIYNSQVLYAVVGDTGPPSIIGEASYASAAALGIDPDPKTGGTDSGVTYIFFQGSQRVSPIENHNNAVTLGQQLAHTFVNNN